MDTPECEWNLGGSPPDCKNGMYQRIHLPEPRGGKIPTEISLLSSLTSLDLSASLTPLELSALDRRFAPLIGTIPEEISFLTLLSELSLANNSLRGAVPTELSALTKLTKLRLENNLLTALPLEFGKFSHLVEMQVSQNNIVGTVPNELCQLAITGSLERLCVDCYRFECICCSCCRDTLLALFDSRSPDYRMIESAYAYLPVRIAAANPQAFDWWTQPAERQSTYSHDARFGRFALASIYFATGGENWTNTGNHRWLSHESACTWENYECNAVHHTAGLTLAYSNLVGTLPSEGLLYLPNMATVHLQANQLYGILPSEFAMMEKMTSLRLQQNQFSGTIPDELFAFASTNEAAQLGELQELYLDHNRLSGTIPNLSSFRSEEPNEASEEALLLFAERPFERLISIKELRLDNNQLSGPIPTFFGKFVNLEILTLHNNSLSGHVPFEVCGLFVIGSLKKLTIDCDLVQCDCQCECISAYSSAGDGASGNFSNT
ncbi:Leucine Rich Repeat [Seminavis robusta]|uniref:Leucine Rich Repeat n=1 Tax=Seminavis robusta TaxID=568900 RepID=A0A9N8E1Q3_9STRA|nr:Leucine Rich Repeat [Seminavis robusta]|eukprot:Sro419_g139080.1 Leucine Rich Repeat (493) ;mRNA; f:32630-34108